MVAVVKVFQRPVCGHTVKNINDNKLDLHFFGYKSLYVNACVLTDRNVVPRLSKSRKIWRKLNKNTVILN